MVLLFTVPAVQGICLLSQLLVVRLWGKRMARLMVPQNCSATHTSTGWAPPVEDNVPQNTGDVQLSYDGMPLNPVDAFINVYSPDSDYMTPTTTRTGPSTTRLTT